MKIVADMSMTINFNLKDPSKEHSLVFVVIRIAGRTLRVSTQQNVLTASFDKKKQRCFTSKEKFSPRDNRHNEEVNKVLDEIVSLVYRIYNSSIADSDLLSSIHSGIATLTERNNHKKQILQMNPIEFFTYYVCSLPRDVCAHKPPQMPVYRHSTQS